MKRIHCCCPQATVRQDVDADLIRIIQGKRVVFTNGCFDLPHLGHAYLLQLAKQLGDFLVVAINDDESVRRLGKGPGRPVLSQAERARLISHHPSVDWVIFFAEDTPLRVISAIRPHVIVKGSDYAEREVVGEAEGKAWGVEIVLIDVIRDLSTTEILTRVQAHWGDEGRRQTSLALDHTANSAATFT